MQLKRAELADIIVELEKINGPLSREMRENARFSIEAIITTLARCGWTIEPPAPRKRVLS